MVVLLLVAACGGDNTPATSPAPIPPTPTTPDVLVPGNLLGWGSNAPQPYQIGTTRTRAHSGQVAAYVSGSTSSSTNATLAQTVHADVYRGRRVRWSAWVRHTDLVGPNIGLWMRVDGFVLSSAFDNMTGRSLSGTADWHQVSVVLDVPSDAVGIAFGIIMNGTGTLIVDDARLDLVSSDVASTNILPVPTALSGRDSAATAAAYANTASVPTNLGFESQPGAVAPIPAVTQASIDWLTRNSSALTTTDPKGTLTDLASLRQIVGSAHVVGLGEGTHGTSQFFQMKHRILEYLVSQMGFTVFAIEATTPESNDLNQYVLNGVGDPRILLSRLYFWTWNTQEVLDMILWMRQWNSTAPPGQKVQFLGFDMQHAGASLDSVQAFVSRVDLPKAAFVAQRFQCLAASRNHEEVRGIFAYAAQAASIKLACAAGLREVYDLIASQRASYEAASSPVTYQLRLHDARLVQQYESYLSTSSEYLMIRDRAMAENVAWIRDQVGSNAKVVLWAHNAHISRAGTAMGGHLRAMYGTDYVNLAFLFGSGTFNSIGFGSVASDAHTPTPWQATLVAQGSLESAFIGTNATNLLVDARPLTSGAAGTTTLRGPITMRLLAEAFDPAQEAAFVTPVMLPDDFDLLIYLKATTASTLLPFVYR